MKFEYLLLFAGLGLAFCAAFYSIIGITTLFSSAMVSTGIMTAFLELGKIVSISFLYQYWDKCQKFLKVYLSCALVILMVITSLGIGGMLLSAYQKSSLEFKANQEKIVMIESQKPFYTNMIVQSESRIRTLSDVRVIQEARLSEAITNAFLSRNPLQLKQLQEQTINLISQANEEIRTESGQIRTNQTKIMSINEEVNTMRLSSAGKKDIRTFQFVAEQFGTTLDKVAKWFIFTLIFVFDPLAIALILAYNVAVFKKIEEKSINPQPEPPTELPKKELTAVNIPEKIEIIDSSVNPPPEIVSQIINDNTSSLNSVLPTPDIDSYWKRMFKL